MQAYIIFSLFGNYSKISEELEKELSGNQKETSETVSIEKLTKEQLLSFCRGVLSENKYLKEQNKLMKEELDELYLKYDETSAILGKTLIHLQDAAATITPNIKEPNE